MLKQSQCECDSAPQVRYRHRLTVQSPDPDATPGEDGHINLKDSANWLDVGTIKARFLSRGGRESRVFDQVEAEITDIVETPSTGFSRAIHPRMRILDSDSVIYNLTAAYDVDRERRIVRIHLIKVV